MKADWRIGTEHEKFGFDKKTLGPVPHEGPRGIGELLGRLSAYGWDKVFEGDHLIALKKEGASVTLEPGGQLELSGAPLETLHQTCDEVHTHLDQVRTVADQLDLGFIGIGASPVWSREETPIMPKGRYAIMRQYMQTKGNLGLDMMFRTCTIQVNLDFSSENDMVKKFRVALALQSVATALFANSPFLDNKPNGFLSFRSHVWTDTDPDRTGVLGFVFEDGMGFERYADYALDVPMYFVYRKGHYHDVSGKSFRNFLDGRLEGFEGELPTLNDWVDHLTTIFPEVRLKHFLEMRGADGGPWRRICALPALWVGLLYEQSSLDAAWDLVKSWSVHDIEQLRLDVAKLGLRAEIGGRTVLDIARDVLELSTLGLRARQFVNADGMDESLFLEALYAVIHTGQTPAEDLLALYNEEWNEQLDPLFTEEAY